MQWKHVVRYREDHTCVMHWTTWEVISLGKGVLWWQFRNLFAILQKFRCLQHCVPRFFMKTISAVSKCYVTWHKCRDRHIFGGAKDFCPNFPKLARKVFERFLPTTFLPQRTWRSVCDVISKKGLNCVFLQTSSANNVRRHFCPDFQGFRFSMILLRFSEVLPEFSGILLKFSTIQNFWGCACTPGTLASCITVTWQ